MPTRTPTAHRPAPSALWRTRRLLVGLAIALAPALGCETSGSEPDVAEPGAGEPGVEAPGAEQPAPEAPTPEAPEPEMPEPEMPEQPEPLDFAGHCIYVNPFSSGEECKAYIGAGWTIDAAESDCAEGVLGGPGAFTAGEDCAFPAVLGDCFVDAPEDQGYRLTFPGDDASACGGSELGCGFANGRFEPAGVCAEDAPPPGVPSERAFPFGEQICQPSLDDRPGQTDGSVCTWDAIQGCTEPGRRFTDYVSCETSWTQRGYYPVPTAANTPADDPRLQDEAYMADMQWLTEQVEACSCTCCHSEQDTPNGPSLWFVEDGPIWMDSVSDAGIAMFAGFAESEAFGAFPPAVNNGFSRDRTGLPTTDVERLQRFLRAELDRRGVDDPSQVDWYPFGGPLVTQREYAPEACANGEGIDADGTLTWSGGGARYVYVLEADAENPGTPPNLDLPDGTLWRVDVPREGAPVQDGIIYGVSPEGTFQRWPAEGEPLPLEPGRTYHLHVLADIIRPITRCLFVYEG